MQSWNFNLSLTFLICKHVQGQQLKTAATTSIFRKTGTTPIFSSWQVHFWKAPTRIEGNNGWLTGLLRGWYYWELVLLVHQTKWLINVQKTSMENVSFLHKRHSYLVPLNILFPFLSSVCFRKTDFQKKKKNVASLLYVRVVHIFWSRVSRSLHGAWIEIYLP